MVDKKNDMRFKRTSIKPSNDLKFDSNMLKIFLAVDERKTVLELFKETRLPPEVFKQGILRLLKLNLIEQIRTRKEVVVERKTDYISSSFINRLREVLTDLLGPLGELLIEDAAEEMNIDVSKIPTAKITDFIYYIARLIPEGKQAATFKNIMIQEIWNRNLN